MTRNLLLNTDSYKLGVFLQYPKDTRAVSAFVTTRGNSFRPEVMFFGLQMFLKDYLSKPISRGDIEEAEEIARHHGQPFDRKGWEHILNAHGGLLPLRIEALPEGAAIRRGVPVMQVVNTDPLVPWLTSYMETALLRAVWYPSTVATNGLAHPDGDTALPGSDNGRSRRAATEPDQRLWLPQHIQRRTGGDRRGSASCALPQL